MTDIKAKIDKLNKRREQLTSELSAKSAVEAHLLTKLKSEFGVETLQDANSLLSSLKGKLGQLEQEIERILSSLEEKVGK